MGVIQNVKEHLFCVSNLLAQCKAFYEKTLITEGTSKHRVLATTVAKIDIVVLGAQHLTRWESAV